MFFKNFTLWFQKVLVILLMSVAFVIPTSGDTYEQWMQAGLNCYMTSGTLVDAPDGSTPSTRQIIGLGERVLCSIDSSTWYDYDCNITKDRIESDTIGDRVWGCSSGGTVNPAGVTGFNYTTLTADMDPGSPKVAVNVYDSEIKYNDSPVYKSRQFYVIAPNGATVSVDSNPGHGTSGNNTIGAYTHYNYRVNPLSVCFSNVSFREHILYQPLPNWPDGTFLSKSAEDVYYGVGQDNYSTDGDHIADGPFPKSRLDNDPTPNVNYVDHSYDVDWTDQYQNENQNWVNYVALSTTTSYKGSTLECQIEYQGVPGSWQGPWQ